MLIRYFAAIDDTPLGKMAMAYCESMVKLGHQVRLLASTVANLQVDQRGKSDLEWSKFRRLLTTPMAGRYVNVVCTESEYWGKLWTSTEFDLGCVRNVLLCMLDCAGVKKSEVADTARYQVVCLPSEDLAEGWRANGIGCIAVEPEDHRALDAVLRIS